jgi:molybdopterin synthase sulfur carrier subunit
MRILYFAWLREKIGAAEENLDLPPDVTTVAALISWLKTIDPAHTAAFANPKLVRCALDEEIAGPEASISGATEIAFFPPVTGG